MAYRVVTLAWEDDEAWGARLLEELGRQEGEGFTLSAMTPRTLAIRHAAGEATRYTIQFVCVFHREATP